MLMATSRAEISATTTRLIKNMDLALEHSTCTAQYLVPPGVNLAVLTRT